MLRYLLDARGVEFHPAFPSHKDRGRLACSFVAYVPANPNMFSVSDPSNDVIDVY